MSSGRRGGRHEPRQQRRPERERIGRRRWRQERRRGGRRQRERLLPHFAEVVFLRIGAGVQRDLRDDVRPVRIDRNCSIGRQLPEVPERGGKLQIAHSPPSVPGVSMLSIKFARLNLPPRVEHRRRETGEFIETIRVGL